MNKRKIYLFTSTTVFIVLIAAGIFMKMNNAKNGEETHFDSVICA